MDFTIGPGVSVQAEGITKHVGAQVAVDNVWLTVRQGEFFGFLGPNGAGKSTTIRMLCGLLKPDAGRVQVAGYDLAAQPLEVKRNIGVLPEETNLYERLTGQGVLIFTDMFGGTPTNLALTFLEKGRVEVLTGVNLPMLIKLANLKKSANLLAVAQDMREHGRNAIWVASDLLRGEKTPA